MSSVHEHDLSSGELFRVAWTGWFWGAGSIFMPLFLVGVVVIVWRQPSEAFEATLILFMVPAILAAQGLIIGGAIALGIVVHRRLVSRVSSRLPPSEGHLP